MIYTKICKNRRFPTALLTFGMGIAMSYSLFILPVFAREPAIFKIDKETPDEFPKVQKFTGYDITSTDGEIFKYLDKTQCGGWMYDETVEGKIAEIIDTPEGTESDVPPGNDITIIPASLRPPPGLPGRKGEWNGNIPSGMARREDEFTFPYAAEGYIFAHYKEQPICDLIFTNKSAYMDPGQELCKDPNQDAPEKNAERCNTDCEYLNQYQYSVERISDCLRFIKTEIGGEIVEVPDFYRSDDPDKIEQLQCNSCYSEKDIIGLEFVGKKFTCTGHVDEFNREGNPNGNLLVPYGWVWGDQNQSALQNLPQACKKYWVKEPTEYPNCTSCGAEDHITVPGETQKWMKNGNASGLECRCPGGGCSTSTRTKVKELNDLNPPGVRLRTVDYKSFYRQYLGKYTRTALTVDEKKGHKKGEAAEVTSLEGEDNGRVGCYGWYEEFDPLTTAHTDEKQVCVIDIYGKDRNEKLKDQMRKTQNIRGAYGQVSKYNNPDPNNPEEDRNQRKNTDKEGNPVKCDEEDLEKKNLWCPKLSGGLSLLDEEVFNEKLKKNLSLALLNLDAGVEKATVQLSTDKPLAEHSLMRAFDDTVTNDGGPIDYNNIERRYTPGGDFNIPGPDRRTIAEWWQEQETEANTLFSPPTVRLILPAQWVAGLDPSDPLFNPKPVVIDRNRDSRTQAIEVQIKAREDLVGEVAAFLERSLLFEITEEPIPIVLPMASPTELRSLATQWCTWWIAKENADKKDEEKITNCDGAPAKIDALRKRLEEYANRIEETRRLRSELAHYLGRVLESQRTILKPIIFWFEQNVTAYETFLEERKKLFAGDENLPDEGLFPLWQEIQKELQKFHDSVNFPWCMNQRFTTSVYSLLDPWMPGRWKEPIEMDGGQRCTEADTINPPEKYTELDCLPVLRLHGESIPRATDAVFDLSLFSGSTTPLSVPVLKPILLKIDETKLAPRPGEDIPELPELPGIEPIRNLMRNEENIKQLFPKSETRSAPSVMQAPKFLTPEERSHLKTMMGYIKQMTDEMTAAYKKFWDSLKSHKDLECTGESCVHVEMDLLERFTRIGSRPAVHLKEDFDSKGSPRKDSNTCPPNDHVCLYLNHEKRYPKEGWQIILPKKDPQKEMDVIQKLREEARTVTLPPPIGEQDPKLFDLYDTNMSDLLPPFDIPGSLDLTPYPDLVPPENP